MSERAIAEEVARQLARVREGAESFVGEAGLSERLAVALRKDRPLRVKLGLDPSSPDIHIGHTVVLAKLRCFQDLGHTAIFLVGDFTARIGDPSGRKKTRPPLDDEAIRANAATYVDQVETFLDVSRAEVRYNSEWMDCMSPADFVRLCSRGTVAQLLERDDFARRFQAEEPISVHELLYPFVQAYDSVALRADVELGGTDQTFNLLMGREIQRDYDQPPQAVLTLPLVVGTDGREKMSKSLGNAIGIREAPEEIYGKAMRISDPQMLTWFDQLGLGEWEELRAERQAVGRGEGSPMAFKQALAERLVARCHGPEAAAAAADHFRRVVQKKELPEEIPEVTLVAGPGGMGVLALIAQSMNVSNREARRLVAQGAVRLNQER
ncbi:MAG: tyrosine--tRNA ligase, partial [Myxococcota bacterium]